MKNNNILLFFTSILFFFSCMTSTISAGDFDFSSLGNGAPSLEELDAFVKELTLETFKMQKGREPNDEGELQEFENELQKMGEQVLEEIIEEGKKSGKSESEALDSFFSDLLTSIDQEGEGGKPEQESISVPTKPEKKPVNLAEITNLKAVLANLIEVIHSFRVKVSGNRQMRNNLLPYKYRLEDLVYLLHALENEQLITRYLDDPEAKKLVDSLKNLYTSLSNLEAQFNPNEESIDQASPYDILNVMISADADEIIAGFQKKMRTLNSERKRTELAAQGLSDQEIEKQLQELEAAKKETIDAYEQLRSQEEAKFIFESIVRLFDQVIEQDKILDQIKTVLEKYKKDSLETIKQREKEEKEARDTQEKALRTRPLLYPSPEKTFYWPSSSSYSGGGYYGGGSNYIPDYSSPGSFDFGTNTSDTSSKLPGTSGGGTGASRGGAGGKKEDKEKESSGEKKSDAKKESSSADKKSPEAPKKAEIDKEVSERLVITKEKLKDVESTLMNNFNVLKDATVFMTTPFHDLTTPAGQEELAKATKIKDAMTELTTNIDALTKSIKKEVDKFKKKPEKRKVFEAEIKKEIEKLQQKIEGKYSYTSAELKKLKEDKKITDPNKASTNLMCLFEKLSPEQPKGIPVVIGGDMPSKKDPSLDKALFFFGIDDAGIAPAQKTELLKSNPVDAEGKSTNFVKILQDSYKSLQNVFKKDTSKKS